MQKDYGHNRFSYMMLCVVAQAVRDAFFTQIKQAKKNKSRSQGTNYYEVVSARYWLTEGGKDFYDVCGWAKVSADRIRRISRQLLAAPYEERMEKINSLMVALYGKKTKKYYRKLKKN